MPDSGSFTSFMIKIRGGNQDAARELVKRFEGIIRREVHLRLEDSRMLRVFDSMDISQSVLTSFFARACSGDFDLETPEQLAGLLIGMTRNKVAYQVRKQRAQRRDNRLTSNFRVDEMDVASTIPSPSQQVSDNDLIDAVRLRLGDEERQIADLRADGHEWAEVARRLGGTPHARRMQLARAVGRVSKLLRLDDPD